jgi:Arc/MetJ family transcription regulator
MRTTLDLDDSLMEALLAAFPGRSKTEAIESALAAYLSESAAAWLRAQAGTVELEDASVELRRADRR